MDEEGIVSYPIRRLNTGYQELKKKKIARLFWALGNEAISQKQDVGTLSHKTHYCANFGNKAK